MVNCNSCGGKDCVDIQVMFTHGSHRPDMMTADFQAKCHNCGRETHGYRL